LELALETFPRLPFRIRSFVGGCAVALVVVVLMSLWVPEEAFLAGAIYSAASWFIAVPLYFHDLMTLRKYLLRRHPHKWHELTQRSGGFVVPANLAIYRLVRSRDDLGDPALALLLRNMRITQRLPLVLFVHYPLVLGWAAYCKFHA
jgi:hypothetical protein